MDYKYTKQALNTIGEDVVDKMQAILMKNNKIATRQLYNSIDYNVSIINNSPALEITYAKHGIFVKSVNRYKKQPPVEAIKKWLQVKNIPIGGGKTRNITGTNLKVKSRAKQLESLAWAIAKKIKQRGTLNPAFNNPTNFTKPFDEWRSIKRNQDLIKNALIKDIKADIKNNKLK